MSISWGMAFLGFTSLVPTFGRASLWGDSYQRGTFDCAKHIFFFGHIHGFW